MRTLHNIDLKNNESGFTLRWQDRLILSHTADAPCLWIGAGEARRISRCFAAISASKTSLTKRLP